MDLIDITGHRFGDLTALHTTHRKSKKTGAWWLCRCKCGTEKAFSSDALRRTDRDGGKTCGHGRDLKDRIFGRLTVIGRAPKPDGERNQFWYCRCYCGNHKAIRADTLMKGRAKSCGCLQWERQKNWNAHLRKPWSKRSAYYDPSVPAPLYKPSEDAL